MRRRFFCLSLALAAILFGACSGGPASSGAPSGAGKGLDGKTYLSTAVQGAVLAGGTRIRLSFTNGSISASGGCNTMGGSYTITGGRLAATQMSMTDMGCDPARNLQDQWLAKLLGGATVALAGDTLTLTQGPIQVTLLDRKVADPNWPLEGTRWVLDGILSNDTASSVPAGVTASIRIADGRIAVETGCNSGGGTIEVQPATLKIGKIGSTFKLCPPETSFVERALTGVLANTVNYAIDADVLTISSGNAGLTFRATP
ncbi:MAG: META domain-containing protein [Chloroflexota bacterium]